MSKFFSSHSFFFFFPFSLESTPLRFSHPPLYQDWIIVITNGLHIAKSSGQWTVIILLDHELERGYLATKSLFLPIWTISPKLICSYIWPYDWVLANGMWVEGSYATSKPDSWKRLVLDICSSRSTPHLPHAVMCLRRLTTRDFYQ